MDRLKEFFNREQNLLIHITTSILVIVFGSFWIAFLLFIIFLGIKELVEFLKLKKDFNEMKYINIKGKPKNIKLIRNPKKRSFPAPVIDDIILFFDDNIKIKYHIMYAYDKQSFSYERIKEDLINYECDYNYLAHSHFVTKYDPELGKCLNKSLKRINVIIKQKK